MADGSIKRYTGRKRQRYYERFVCRYRLNADVLEAGFFENMAGLDAEDSVLRRWVDAPRLGSRERNAAAKELASLQAQSSEGEEKKRKDRAFDLALDAKLGEAELRRQLERITDEFAARRERVRAIREQLDSSDAVERTVERARTLLRSFGKLYAAAPYEQKRELISGAAEALGGVTVSKDGLRWLGAPGRSKEQVPRSASWPRHRWQSLARRERSWSRRCDARMLRSPPSADDSLSGREIGRRRQSPDREVRPGAFAPQP